MLRAVEEELEKRRALLLSFSPSSSPPSSLPFTRGSGTHTKFSYENGAEVSRGVVEGDGLEVVWSKPDEADEDEDTGWGGKRKKKVSVTSRDLFAQ